MGRNVLLKVRDMRNREDRVILFTPGSFTPTYEGFVYRFMTKTTHGCGIVVNSEYAKMSEPEFRILAELAPPSPEEKAEFAGRWKADGAATWG